MSDSEEEKEVISDIRNPDVMTKYRLAADITNQAMDLVIAACVAGASVLEICKIGDNYILEETSKIFNKKGKHAVSKGIGFPTCVTVNNKVGSFSAEEGDESTLAEGDLVKLDLGTHIDGFCSQAAHTIQVGGGEITGRKADVVAAVFTASECVQRMLKAGCKNDEITDILDKIAKTYGVSTVENVYSHNSEQYNLDGEKNIANNIPDKPPSAELKLKGVEVEPNEVWTLDIVMSTGTGRGVQQDERTTTVYERRFDNQYKLKMKAPRALLHEIDTDFSVFPFSVRHLKFEPKKLRFALSNLLQHQLIAPFPIIEEHEGEFVAHVKFTMLVTANKASKITAPAWDMSNVKSEVKIEDADILAALALPLPKKKAKKKKNKKKN